MVRARRARHTSPMHVPAPFRTSHDDALAIAVAHPFATLVASPSLEFAHVPLLLDDTRTRLLGHVARASAMARAIADGEVLVAIFRGPHAYVSPRFYRTSPQVPTWNYVAAHVRGRAEVATNERAIEILLALTRYFEPEGSTVAESLPRDFVESLSHGILAFELAIESVLGKAKLGQNRAEIDRASAIDALEREGGHGADVARLMRIALERR